MVTRRNKIAPLLLSMLLVTTALVPTMAGASEELRVVSDAEGDAVEEGGGAADLLELRAQTNATRLNFTIQVVDASDNPRLIQYRVGFTNDQSYTAKVSYQTDGDLVSAFVGEEPIDASWSDNNLTLSIEREDVGSPADGDNLTDISAESRHGEDGSTFDLTDVGDYRVGNSAPDLGAISDKTVDEGQNLNFNVSATDADGDDLSLSAEDVPAGASFSSDGDADGDGTYNGTFDWTPSLDQAGTYNVSFVADDGDVTSSQTVQITVNNVTGAPEIEPIANQTVDEGATLEFNVTATDPNGDTVTVDNETALPGSSTFTFAGDADGDGTYNGTFAWTPDFDKAGTYNVTFVADDGTLESFEDVSITVNDVDSAPSIEPIENRTVEEGNVTSFNLTATDAEGDTITWNASDLPEGAVFADLGDLDGDGTYNATFDWKTNTSNAGSYAPTFIADDGSNTNNVTVGILVTEKAAPELDPVDDQFVEEGASLILQLNANDPDDDPLVFDNTTALPDGASLSEDGLFTWDAEQGQAGSYEIGVSVSDGTLSDEETFTVHVLETNGAPSIDAPSSVEVFETDTVSFGVTATDPDGDELSLSASGLPANASFTDAGDGTGTFEWTPTYGEAGNYSVSFTVTDSDLSDTTTTSIGVEGAVTLEIEMRHSAVSPTEDPRVEASLVNEATGEPLANVEVTLTAYWADSASEEIRFEQEESGRTTSNGEALITLDRDVQDLVNAPGEHIVEASATWEDPTTGQTVDLSGSTSYTVS